MLCASAVDGMLKAIGFVEGTLYARINQAKIANKLTEGMAEWAHQVRLEANDPRHADPMEPHKTPDEAQNAIRFTEALAELLFVLPAKITRGLSATKTTK